jgi:hypothetical protein
MGYKQLSQRIMQVTNATVWLVPSSTDPDAKWGHVVVLGKRGSRSYVDCSCKGFVAHPDNKGPGMNTEGLCWATKTILAQQGGR